MCGDALEFATLPDFPPLLLLAPIAFAVGCALVAEESGTTEGDIRPAERAIVGAGVPYAGDADLDGQAELLATSQKARREVAWRTLAKVLAETNIAEAAVHVGDERPKLPVFRTWYQKDDLERMFARVYEGHGAAARRARKPLAPAAMDEAFAFNATDRGGLSPEDYAARVDEIDTSLEAQGLGGNARVSYSGAVLRHAMENYARLSRCARGEIADDPLAAPASPTNFSTCFDAELPKDAAVVKSSWLRADFDLTVPVRPTTPEVLRARLAGKLDEGGWGAGKDQQASPDERSIYTVRMSDGATFRLPALHLVTKELRHWLWISIWWSPEPDTDFGADRPDAIRRLGGPWASYKMCVVTDFEEKDPDPTGGFPTGPGSLGDALAAVHAGASGPTWCSNPYLERGQHNAQTNCIGCHQHAGTNLQSEDVLADPEKFPASGRRRVRNNFPSDYLFAATALPEGLAQIIDAQVSHFDSIDLPPTTR
jgi:hypothetical protein